jgi:hypothetical protein
MDMAFAQENALKNTKIFTKKSAKPSNFDENSVTTLILLECNIHYSDIIRILFKKKKKIFQLLEKKNQLKG